MHQLMRVGCSGHAATTGRQAHLELQQWLSVAKAAGGDPPQAILPAPEQPHVQALQDPAACFRTPGLICSAGRVEYEREIVGWQ
jgi:hypothetical protein